MYLVAWLKVQEWRYGVFMLPPQIYVEEMETAMIYVNLFDDLW